MLDLSFKSSLGIAFYVATMQYLTLFILVPISIILQLWDRVSVSLPLIPLMVFCAIAFVACEDRSAGLITVKDSGLAGYSFKKFSKIPDFVKWEEIYQVEAFRYYGLPFFLVRYHRSEYPLWLPLFLVNQNKLNFVILERIWEEHPLKMALLSQKDFFQKVPWHSKPRNHKSDRFILENSYSTRFYCTFKQYFFYSFIASSIILVLEFLLYIRYNQLAWDKPLLIFMGGMAALLFVIFGLIWNAFLKETYLELKYNGIAFCSKSFHKYRKWFLDWSRLYKIKYRRYLMFSELQLIVINNFNQSLSLYTIPQFWLIDRDKFKATVINDLPLEHPLSELATKYL